MSRWQVAVQVFPPFRRRVSRRWLRQAAELALAQEPPEEAVEMGLVVADDETLRRLNRDYRGLDEVTDVLAFPFRRGGGPGEEAPFIAPPESTFPLGEVVLSYPQAVRQARQHRWTVKEELALLVAHGVLHLLGHDHAEPAGERAMRAREEAVLSRVFQNTTRCRRHPRLSTVATLQAR